MSISHGSLPHWCIVSSRSTPGIILLSQKWLHYLYVQNTWLRYLKLLQFTIVFTIWHQYNRILRNTFSFCPLLITAFPLPQYLLYWCFISQVIRIKSLSKYSLLMINTSVYWCHYTGWALYCQPLMLQQSHTTWCTLFLKMQACSVESCNHVITFVSPNIPVRCCMTTQLSWWKADDQLQEDEGGFGVTI